MALRGFSSSLCVALSLGAHPAAAQTTAIPPIKLQALSTRADLVSGGDVLVQLSVGESGPVSVTLNGRDVTSSFRVAERELTRRAGPPDPPGS